MKCQNTIQKPQTSLLLTLLVSPPMFVDCYSLCFLNVGSERLHYIIDRTKMGHRDGETDTISSPPTPAPAAPLDTRVNVLKHQAFFDISYSNESISKINDLIKIKELCCNVVPTGLDRSTTCNMSSAIDPACNMIYGACVLLRCAFCCADSLL